MNYKESSSFIVWAQRALDVFIPIAILYILASLYSVNWSDKYQILAILGGLLLVVFNQSTGAYSLWRGYALFSGFRLVIQAWVFTWLALLALTFLFKDSSYYSRFVLTGWAIITPFVLLLYRFILRSLLGKFRTQGWSTRKVAILGAGMLGHKLATTLTTAKMLGYVPVCFYDDDVNLTNTAFNGIPVSGTIDEFLKTKGLEDQFDEIYITLPLRAEKRIKEILYVLSDSTITVKFIPDYFTFDLLHSRITDIAGIPIISVYDSPLNNLTNKVFKRLEDIVLSIIIILLISPLLLIISILVKTTSEGPVIFKQKRYGLNGKEINVWKFRSMYATEDDGSVIQAKKNDRRITPIGAFLRKTSLDELPQFFNALSGRMSIVGPRPHATAHNEQHRKQISRYMLRHTVKPGITGWAQVNGWRGETDTLDKMVKRVEFDLFYIDNWSIWLDLKIIMLTVIKGFINKNAY
ncbi:MAG: undecaprenyl-phosphate glucose phosphotransferase [Gammaproteobacteria bacterium]|nr:undecaprenyl-phosphate glucose phosphotransferase [Gammaproteobacteria bacterium]